MPHMEDLVEKFMDNSLSSAALPLVQSGVLGIDEALDLQASARNLELDFIEYLIKYSVFSAKQVAEKLADYFNYSFVNLQFANINLNIASSLPLELVQTYKFLPLYVRDFKLHIALADPTQYDCIAKIKFHTSLDVIPVVVEYDKLQKCLLDYLDKVGSSTVSKNQHEQAAIVVGPVVDYVNFLLNKAILKNASDMHFEPYENSYRIRLRLDGLLHTLPTPENHLAVEVCARIKVLANINIVEKRLPQDGRFTFKLVDSELVDCRVSICPTVYGEKIVIRFLNKANSDNFKIEDLCLDSRDQDEFLRALASPQGLILVSGPTGSGKSTTLYTALKYLNTDNVNIVSIEDPVEVQISGINQIQVSQNLSFAKILRAVLRQDPDIIMLGEIRDLETAQIAVQAAQTGHLVLASIHTNSAVQTIIRLVNIGIPIYNLVDSLRMIIAQRLLRKLCTVCRKHQKSNFFVVGHGCRNCNNGYSGRQAIFEVMPISLEIKLCLQSKDFVAANLEEIACQQGMQLLKNAGIAKIVAGNTSYRELQRVCEI